MRKLLTIAAAMILFAVSANAQTYVNIGYGLSRDKTTFGSMDTDASNSNAIFAGVSHNFGIGGDFGVEPGLNYLHNFSNISDDGLTVKNRYHGIQVPVLFNYAIVPSSNFTFKFLAGPAVSLGLSDKSTTYAGGVKGYTINNYKDGSYRRLGLSASLGLAAELYDIIRLKIGYDFGLTDLQKSDDICYKQNMLTFSLGYIF